MQNLEIAVVNQSSVVDHASLVKMVDAVNLQIARDVAPKWLRQPARVMLYPDLPHVPKDRWLVVILDNADVANALGYHDETPDGRIYSRVFAKTVLSHHGTLLTGPNSVSVTLSHEVIEMFADPNINTWADNGGAEMLAWELGDPVEATSYIINGVAVSNFVLMSYFDMQNKTGPYDMLGLLKAPWSMLRGGYQILRTGGQITSKFGDEVPEWKTETKMFPASRTTRRMVTALPKENP